MIFHGYDLVGANNTVIKVDENVATEVMCIVRDGEAVLRVNGREVRGHQVKSHLIGPPAGTIVSYQSMKKVLERSAENITCNSGFHGRDLASSVMALKLDMDYSPTFTIRRDPVFGIPVIEGMTVTLECEVDSRPKIDKVTWIRNEATLKSDLQYLVITDVNKNDIGWYQCSTVYKNETFSSIGYFLNVAPSDKSVISPKNSMKRGEEEEEELKQSLRHGDQSSSVYEEGDSNDTFNHNRKALQELPESKVVVCSFSPPAAEYAHP